MFVMYLAEDAGLKGSKMLYRVGQNKASFAHCFLFSGFFLGEKWERQGSIASHTGTDIVLPDL